MKLQAEVDGQVSKVELQRDGERIRASVDGREYDLEISEPEPGVILMRVDGRIYEAFLSQANRPDEPNEVTVNGTSYEVRVFDPKRLRGSATDHAQDDGLVEIKAAMPGKVVQIVSAVGEKVEKGAGVIVVEAMKMQNQLRSTKDGTIKEVRVSEGSTVNAGDVLVVIE
jgi:biotin carboxyl carrier protein